MREALNLLGLYDVWRCWIY